MPRRKIRDTEIRGKLGDLRQGVFFLSGTFLRGYLTLNRDLIGPLWLEAGWLLWAKDLAIKNRPDCLRHQLPSWMQCRFGDAISSYTVGPNHARLFACADNPPF
jgi:hypothetical protein